MPNLTAYKLLEACREAGCPVCQMEQWSVKRYLDNHFYENVNSPKWRDKLRASLGFCHEHAWLAVNQRLGDALGFSIIYRDIVSHVLDKMDGNSNHTSSRRRLGSFLGQAPVQARTVIERMLAALTPRKPCPACEHREQTTRATLSILIEELSSPEMTDALKASDGLCFAHLRLALENARSAAVSETLLVIHRAKLERLRAELEEFIRKNDYRLIEEGFGEERDVWLRAITMVAGSRKKG